MLYKSASGREVTHASSSSIDTYRLCRRKFKLSRIDGWKQKDRKASLEIGKCVESALQYYHENGMKPEDFADEFRRLWLKFKDVELVYTDQEKNWASIYTLGVEWAKLYEIVIRNLPIKNPKFQLQFKKKLWPGSKYDDLEFMGYVDILSTLDDGTRIIVDVKTAKSQLPVSPGMMALDGQLRKYAWVSGIREVGFLNFVKSDPNSFRKGVEVSLLEDIGNWNAGGTFVVAKFDSPKDAVEATEGKKGSPAVPWLMLVGTETTVQLMDTELEKITGKGSTEKKESYTASLVEWGDLKSVSRDQITKAKIQFVRGTIPEEDIPEIGQQIGQDIFAIKSASENNGFFKDGGVRFPNAICGWCEMLPICNRNDKVRDETLIQIKPATQDDDWLKELEQGDEE